MSYLETIGKNAKKAFEHLKNVKHKKIKKVLENYNQSLKKNTNKIRKIGGSRGFLVCSDL